MQWAALGCMEESHSLKFSTLCHVKFQHYGILGTKFLRKSIILQITYSPLHPLRYLGILNEYL
jgi:hypothetical protein